MIILKTLFGDVSIDSDSSWSYCYSPINSDRYDIIERPEWK